MRPTLSFLGKTTPWHNSTDGYNLFYETRTYNFHIIDADNIARPT